MLNKNRQREAKNHGGSNISATYYINTIDTIYNGLDRLRYNGSNKGYMSESRYMKSYYGRSFQKIKDDARNRCSQESMSEAFKSFLTRPKSGHESERSRNQKEVLSVLFAVS